MKFNFVFLESSRTLYYLLTIYRELQHIWQSTDEWKSLKIICKMFVFDFSKRPSSQRHFWKFLFACDGTQSNEYSWNDVDFMALWVAASQIFRISVMSNKNDEIVD